jgi:hypothetical protein
MRRDKDVSASSMRGFQVIFGMRGILPALDLALEVYMC